MSIFRFECYLYGKLIVLLLSTHIQAFLKSQYEQQEGGKLELSERKATQYLKKK